MLAAIRNIIMDNISDKLEANLLAATHFKISWPSAFGPERMTAAIVQTSNQTDATGPEGGKVGRSHAEIHLVAKTSTSTMYHDAHLSLLPYPQGFCISFIEDLVHNLYLSIVVACSKGTHLHNKKNRVRGLRDTSQPKLS
jgi:hypothetical protein